MTAFFASLPIAYHLQHTSQIASSTHDYKDVSTPILSSPISNLELDQNTLPELKMASSQFQQAVVHITQNSPDGKTSSFLNQIQPPPTQLISPTSQLSYIYSTPPSFSISSNADLDHHIKILSIPGTPLTLFPVAGGSACVFMDFAPNVDDSPGSIHKTRTLDYFVVLEGEMELELFGGEGKEEEKRVVKKGEVVVQRECWHSWKNPSKTEGARVLCVAVGGEGAVEGEMEWLRK